MARKIRDGAEYGSLLLQAAVMISIALAILKVRGSAPWSWFIVAAPVIVVVFVGAVLGISIVVGGCAGKER